METVFNIGARTLSDCRYYADDVSHNWTSDSSEFYEGINYRDPAAIFYDVLIGKIGEIGFSRFCSTNFGIEYPVEYRVFARDGIAVDERQVFGEYVNVRSIKQGSQWLLVEVGFLELQKSRGRLPGLFVLCLVGWDKVNAEPTGRVRVRGFSRLIDLCEPTLIGSCRNHDLTFRKNGVQFIPRGGILPGANIVLMADNVARTASSMREDWESIDGARSLQPALL